MWVGFCIGSHCKMCFLLWSYHGQQHLKALVLDLDYTRSGNMASPVSFLRVTRRSIDHVLNVTAAKDEALFGVTCLKCLSHCY